MTKRFLFVCTGNQCRSPIAAEMFRKLLKREGINDCEVYSAGTLAPQGYPVTEMTKLFALKMGLDLSNHTTQPLTTELLQESDLVLVMEEIHRAVAIAMYPDASDKIKLLRSYAPGVKEEENIFDPTGSLEPFAYRTCFSLILESLEGLIKHLKSEYF